MSTNRKRAVTKFTANAVERPPSKLLRVPLETYEKITRLAEEDRRSRNHELAVLVEEAEAYRRIMRAIR